MHATQPPPTPGTGIVDEPERSATADVLRRAADHLTKHGWVQHHYYGTNHPHPAACAVGALAIAAYGYPHADPFSAAFDDDDPTQLACWHLFVDAEFALAAYLGLHTIADGPALFDESIHGWNDHPGRTADQVITALHAAADRHQTGGAP